MPPSPPALMPTLTDEIVALIPAYQEGPRIAAVVEAARAHLPVIVVDDGSTDDTAALLARYADPRIRVIRGAHGGIAAARNAGVAAASTPLVAFHDSDDIALPGRLAVPAEFLRSHSDVDVVIQNGRMLPPEDDPAGVEVGVARFVLALSTPTPTACGGRPSPQGGG